MTISYKGGAVPLQRTAKGRLSIKTKAQGLFLDQTISREVDVKITMIPDPNQFTDSPNPAIDKVILESKGYGAFPRLELTGEDIKNSPRCKDLGIGWHGKPEDEPSPDTFNYGWRR